MADDSGEIPPTDPSSASEFTPELRAELYALVDSLLDDQIDAAQLQRLEAIVIGHREAAVLYYELVHLWCILPFHLSRGVIDLTQPEGASALAGTTMDESMVLPAIHQGDVGELEVPLEIAPISPSPEQRRGRPSRPPIKWIAGGGAAAAVLLIGFAAVWHALRRPAQLAVLPPTAPPSQGVSDVEAPAPPTRPVPPAVLSATAGARFEGGINLKPGTALSRGDSIHLTQGGIELTFASAAVVVVRGPAHVRVVDGNRLALESGAIAAHVPVSAHGFRVDSPGSSVVDLGTDFGIRSLIGSGRSELDVFNGLVDAAPLDAAGQAIAKPVRVSTGQAVQLRVADPAPSAVAYKPTEFDRDIKAIRLPLHLHGSGAGLAPGAPDPNWQIVSVPNDPAWQPKPAVVLSSPWPKYAPNTSEGSWISLSDPQRDEANGEYIFRTTVDLSGVDPSTLSAQLQFAVDNQVADIRVNGVSTGATTRKLKADDDFAGYPVALPKASWHAGTNRVDIVLSNNAFDGSDKPSFMGLQAIWTASVSPVVLRYSAGFDGRLPDRCRPANKNSNRR